MEDAKSNLNSIFNLCLPSNIKLAKITFVLKLYKMYGLVPLNFQHSFMELLNVVLMHACNGLLLVGNSYSNITIKQTYGNFVAFLQTSQVVFDLETLGVFA